MSALISLIFLSAAVLSGWHTGVSRLRENYIIKDIRQCSNYATARSLFR